MRKLKWTPNKAFFLMVIILSLATYFIDFGSAMYAGESKNYSLSELGLSNITDVSISNNISEIVYSFTNDSVTITIPYDAPPQDFIITINGFKEETPVIVTTSSGGGGRSHSKKKVVSTNTTNETSNIILAEWNYTPPIEQPIDIIPEIKPVESIINTTTDKEVKMITNTTWMWIIIGIIVFLTIIVAILIIASRRKKKENIGRDMDEIVADAMKEIENRFIAKDVAASIPKEETKQEEKKDESGKNI